MAGKGKVRKGNILKEYEWTNLLFYVVVFVALGLFISLVFRMYSAPEPGSSRAPVGDSVILSEVVAQASDMCIFYLGTDVSDSSRTYRSVTEVPASDSGLVKGLVEISGVIEVEVKQRMIVLHKSPSARWNEILSSARKIINQYLQPEG